jgi:AbrB family looped-hinge helix DNA binding protein
MVRLVEVRAVSKNGQVTIPKRLREKYGIKSKVVLEELEKGIALKPLPMPSEVSVH